MSACEMSRIEAIVTVDSKGQILLPKELRERANIYSGDKLVVFGGCDERGELCCLIFVKAEKIEESAKNIIAPMLRVFLNE
ncbi:MAG: AbrB/MazE/SpoVT family DNA-binding domain-containing protein [Archaeoglobi archaeon]|nr:AbrB/MazE/SpoVT family DNA-binding domain-containing protein [Candidatus Mnemosynella sp.]